MRVVVRGLLRRLFAQEVNSEHFSIAHVGGWTIEIMRGDGTLHAAQHNAWTTFGRQLLDCAVV